MGLFHAQGAFRLVLRQRHNGIGIQLPEDKEMLFKLFKRGQSCDHIEGKGIGLYLVKSYVTSLGGHIDIESTPDQGTTFFVYLEKSSPPHTRTGTDTWSKQEPKKNQGSEVSYV